VVIEDVLLLVSVIANLVAVFVWQRSRILQKRLRQNAEEAQRHSASQTTRLASRTAVLELLPDPLLTLDGQVRIIRANRAARRLFGEDILNKPLFAAIRAAPLLASLQQAFHQGTRAETEYLHPGVVERFFRVILEVVPSHAEQQTRFILVFSDVTALKQAARSKADFIANASHELRTPLTTLVGFIETLQGAAKDDPAAREMFLGIMHEQTQRMVRLVQDMLHLQRIERHLHEAPTEQLPLVPVIEKVVRALHLKAEQRQMAIEVAILYPAVVLGDEEEMIQVVQNLLDNAIKYGQVATKVEVSLKTEENSAYLTVRNTGEGINAEDIPRLTERFYRTKTAQEKSDGGTGLGLAIVKKAVSRHGGRLEVHSTPGLFTEFSVVLPVFAGQEKIGREETGQEKNY
jgi:two-component system phosphate regulon sensor histidine kinase PhoR